MIGAEDTLFNIPSVTTPDTLFNIPSFITPLPPPKKKRQKQKHLNKINKIKAQFLKVNVFTFSPYIKQKA